MAYASGLGGLVQEGASNAVLATVGPGENRGRGLRDGLASGAHFWLDGPRSAGTIHRADHALEKNYALQIIVDKVPTA